METNPDGSGTGLATDTITDVSGVYTGVQNVEIEIDHDAKGMPASHAYTLYDKNYFIIASIVVGDAIGSNANYAYIVDPEAGAEYVEDGVYYWEFEAIMDGELVTLTATDEYSDVFSVLSDATYNKHVAELRFNGDYVVKAVELKDEQFYTKDDLKDPIDSQDVYEVTLTAKDKSELRLQGRTLYVLENRDDRGLTFVSDAKAVVIQDEDKKTDVISEYDSVAAALSALADADKDTPELEYVGDITAILNSQGVAEWIVFDNGSKLESNSGAASGNEKVEKITIKRSGEVVIDLDRAAEEGDTFKFDLYQLRDGGYVYVDTYTAEVGSSDLTKAKTNIGSMLIAGETYKVECGDQSSSVAIPK